MSRKTPFAITHWNLFFQEYETMSMEIEELKKGITTATEQMQKTIDDIEQIKEKVSNSGILKRMVVCNQFFIQSPTA